MREGAVRLTRTPALLDHGEYEPLRRDRHEQLDQLRTGDGRALPKHIKAQIGRELDRLELLIEQVKIVETERDALLAVAPDRAIPAAASMLLDIKGVGPEFAGVLWSEGLFRSFDNRRQVATYAGLAPSPWQSGTITESKGCRNPAIHGCERPWSSSPGYGCDISRARR